MAGKETECPRCRETIRVPLEGDLKLVPDPTGQALRGREKRQQAISAEDETEPDDRWQELHKVEAAIAEHQWRADIAWLKQVGARVFVHASCIAGVFLLAWALGRFGGPGSGWLEDWLAILLILFGVGNVRGLWKAFSHTPREEVPKSLVDRQRALMNALGVRGSALAVVACLFAILGIPLGPVGAAGAIVCGHLAQWRIRRSGGRLKGKDKARFALAIGYTLLVLWVVLLWYLLSGVL